MQYLDDGAIVLAATDIAEFLACPHLAQQRLAIARGERGRPRPAEDPHADLIRTRGEAHEREQLARLSAEFDGTMDLSREFPRTREELEQAAATTEQAMCDGAPLIYQAQLFDGRWQGRTDFLRRIDVPSSLGDWSYEVLDTKLARAVKPPVIHQLSLYSRLVGRIQGREHRQAHLLLGDGTQATVDLRRYLALHRHVCARLEQVVAAPSVQTYPEPVAHCAICALEAECYQRWVEDDHLSLVAFARRDHRDKLVEAGLATVLELAHAPDGHSGEALLKERFATLRRQASLQVDSRETGEPVHHHLAPERAAGYALLPDPSPRDVFFDLEGDPYIADAGIEYLWGWWTEDGYRHVWAHNQAAEKASLEVFVDTVVQLRVEYPELHVFHYAPHEKSKIRSLAAQYATREDEVDELLADEVFVDLYAVVRQAMQVGEDSYSLKKLERHHGFERLEKRVREGGGSIVAYEAWLESGDQELLNAIRAYNEEDCRSTASLRDWLQQEMLPEAAVRYGVDFGELRKPAPEDEYAPPQWLPEVEELIAELNTVEDEERTLLAYLLLYHRREGKPAWWRYFDLRGKPIGELLEDRDALACLERDHSVPPVPYKRSHDYTFTFPPQEFRLDTGDAQDPTTGDGYKVVEVADDHVVLRWADEKEPPPPVAMIGGSPINVAVLREALMDLARSVLAGDGAYPAARALLRREQPRLTSGALGESVEELTSAALGLDRSILPIQGPPGTGKTYRAARMILAALKEGRRVGITAPSHAAIQNLLCEIEQYADEIGFGFGGIYKGDGYESEHALIEIAENNDDVDHAHQLVAGTAWLFARPEHRQAFDLLFVDEAGQFALANAAAVALATQSVVLLGDPQQLPQVNQASHPGGSGASVLEHILDGENTLQPEQGVLLTESWRMHPDVCRFVSERSYDSRLASRPDCSRRRVEAPGALTGVGLRSIPILHKGRSQASPEEAERIGRLCRELLAGSMFTDDEGTAHDLEGEHILVVAPYNLAVRTIRQHVPEGVRVGTVDKFQGQEAPVVFYAMSGSAGEDAPRGVDFLFDAHRLNVAVSRAQCLAVLVHSPRLLDTDCPSIETMELLDGICRFVELASPLAVARLRHECGPA